ncbi:MULTISPECIES: TadE/TadG family type IV pilus assembly protein [Pseudomonas]|uniref:TadE/TadG family type IV pilus assembly protein n=1 Tax=Pseudomonas TaxID=286 RepID=UPI001BEC6E4C|nr:MULTISPECIES: TadE/TadG family type IV pilus assembly protein [Pseudomonas]MBT2338888.1 pilus assembly protein [Pseudomonas fluorescens]MCD4527671.1 pilus assembly protein [Pseudomonas sp. C3-2018]
MNPSIRQLFTAPRRQKGAVSVLMVIALVAISMMAALALDGGHMLLNKTRLQNAVDAAALGGAKTLSQVTGGLNMASTTRAAALDTLNKNAQATGNTELATAVAGNPGAFAVVELASSVYGPFSYPGPANAKYVRVSVSSYQLAGFFWNFVQTMGSAGLGSKSVAAIATAGPSPTSPCDLSPLMVCGDPTQYNPGAGNFWGYQFGALAVLKTAAGNSSPIGPGNFQLLDFGSGGSAVREDLAGGGSVCRSVGDNVQTAPGNKAGPTSQGMNTRFGIYNGPISASDYPPDLVTASSTPAMTYDSALSQAQYKGKAVTSSNGDLSAGGEAIQDYNDWRAHVAACVAGGASGCQSNGVFERRMLKIVVGNCTGKQGGSTSIPVLGFGCYFVVQPVDGGGSDSLVFGQFVKECEGDGVPGPTPSSDAGPQIIQLYKTYLNGSGTPSSDS